MDIDELKAYVDAGKFRLSIHAEMEAAADNLYISEIVAAILNDDLLENIRTQDAVKAVCCLDLLERNRFMSYVGLEQETLSLSQYMFRPFQNSLIRGQGE